MSQMMKNGKNHGNFRKKNEEVRSMKNRCEKCDFLGKTPAGLKTHVRKKHWVYCECFRGPCALDYMSSRSYFEFCLICFLSTHKCYCTYEQKTKCMHQLEGDLGNFPIIRTDTLGLEDWREEAWRWTYRLIDHFNKKWKGKRMDQSPFRNLILRLLSTNDNTWNGVLIIILFQIL